jgi:ABC-type nickel/cobalt efflux system permease component RcnA
MNDVVFITIVVTGFTVAFLHAAIPTHWLPFVVAARAQQWNRPKTLAITGVAGAGHVLFTTALGVLVVWGGMAINTRVGNAFPLIAGGAIIALGLFYLIRRTRGDHGHNHFFGRHSHHEHKHEHQHDHEQVHTHSQEPEYDWSRRRSDWAATIGLVALLTFSPCEAFLPVFLTGAKYGWFGFVLLSSVLAIATVAGMVLFTWLTLLGVQRLRFKGLEKYEHLVVGAVFCLLGLVIIFFER